MKDKQMQELATLYREKQAPVESVLSPATVASIFYTGFCHVVQKRKDKLLLYTELADLLKTAIAEEVKKADD